MEIYKSMIFVHLEKTAGTSMRDLFTRRYGAENVAAISTIKELSDFLGKHRGKPCKAVMGHIYYGIHAFNVTYHPFCYYSMLREPMDRFLSAYYFVKRSPGHHMHRYVNDNNVSIKDFAQIPHFRNQQVNRLSSILVPNEKGARLVGSDEKTKLAMALKVLVHDIRHFGIFELMDESVRRLAALMQSEIESVPRLNVGERKQVDELDEATKSAVREANQLDIQLYNHGRRIFESGVTL